MKRKRKYFYFWTLLCAFNVTVYWCYYTLATEKNSIIINNIQNKTFRVHSFYRMLAAVLSETRCKFASFSLLRYEGRLWKESPTRTSRMFFFSLYIHMTPPRSYLQAFTLCNCLMALRNKWGRWSIYKCFIRVLMLRC